jgi:hypothetical protein
MFLRSTKRWKNGKEHYYWSLVENRRCRGNRVLQHTVLYLGEINDSQKEQWIRAIEVFDEDRKAVDQLKLFAAERPPQESAADRVSVRLKEFEMHRARQWGGCWLFTEAWKELGLEEFWREQVVIALIVTPEGFPLAYEVLAGNRGAGGQYGGQDHTGRFP